MSKSELAEMIANLLALNEPSEIINTDWFNSLINQYRGML